MKRVRTSVIIAGLVAVLLLALVLINSNSIFQEGNPLPLIKGMYQIQFGEQTYVKVKDAPETYLTKSQQASDLFGYIEKSRNVKFYRQLGTSYLFKGEGGEITVAARQYTSAYRVWEIPSADGK